MGSPPPPDGPPLAQQQSSAVSAGFAPGPPVASLCGFTLPSFKFFLKFKLPPFPPPLPTFRLSLGLNCSLSNPLNVSAGLEYGGGRVAQSDPDPDQQLAEAA